MECCGHVRGDENPLQGSEHVTTMLGMGGYGGKTPARGQRTPPCDGRGGLHQSRGAGSHGMQQCLGMDILVLYCGKLKTYKNRD